MSDASAPIADTLGSLQLIPLDRIAPDANQPRKHFDEAALNELADSINTHGVVQPITVRPKIMGAIGEGDYDYTIVAGERRWRAGQIAGIGAIPAIVRPDLATDHRTVTVLQLIENLQRAELTLWETAQGCRALVDAIGLEAAAEKLGKSKPWVSQRTSLFDLDPAILERVTNGTLTSVDIAHDLNALSGIDEMGADEVSQLLEKIDNGNPPTREHVRELLKDAREDMEAQALRDRAREQRASDEAAAEAAAKADPNRQLFSNPDDDEGEGDDDDDSRRPPPKTTTATRVESPYEREQRLREAAWTEVMPDCRKLARESRKPLLDALEEAVPDDHTSKDFQITLSAPHTSTDAPATARGAMYGVDVRGNTADAGLVIEALNPSHRVNLNLRVTIAELRRIEALLDSTYPVRTCADYGGSGAMQVRGSQLANAAALILRTQAERDKAAAGEAEQREHIARLLLAEEAAAQAATARNAPADGGQYATAQIARFLKACTQRDAKARTKAGELHAAYIAWCERHNEGTPVGLTDHRWGQGIEAAGIEKKRSNGFVYIGLKLLIEGDQP